MSSFCVRAKLCTRRPGDLAVRKKLPSASTNPTNQYLDITSVACLTSITMLSTKLHAGDT